MRRCDKYKNSEIEWCPQIPEYWQVRPVKARFDIQLGKMLQNDSEFSSDKEVPYLKALHVLWGNVQIGDLPTMWVSPVDISQYGVRTGDLLVCEGGEVGRAGIVYDPPVGCVIQNALHRVRAKSDSDIRFLMYVLYAVAGVDWFSTLCNKATIAHFTREKLTALRIPIPSKDEQQKIADLLDIKTKQIDALVAKKERMIELLKEERTAVINHAVTKGLDAKDEIKDSGIEWLGTIPKRWDLKNIKYIAHVNNSALSEMTEENYEFNYIDISNVDLEEGYSLEDKIRFVNAPSRARRIVRKGDTIVSTVRTYLKAIAHIVDDVKDVIVSTGFAVVSPINGIEPKLLYYILHLSPN